MELVQLTTAAADLAFYDPAQLNWKQPFWSKNNNQILHRLLKFDRSVAEFKTKFSFFSVYKLAFALETIGV